MYTALLWFIQWLVWIVCYLYYICVQGQADSKDCGLIPHYSNNGTVVSFTSATHDSAIIRVEENGHITVSTKTNADNKDTQFTIVNVSNVSVNS